MATWYVDPDASGPTHDGSTWDFAYLSLNAAITAKCTGTLGAPIVFECRSKSGTADTTAITFPSCVTSPTNYVLIRCSGTARHAGKWDATKYRLTGGTNDMFKIDAEHPNNIYVDGLQFWITVTTEHNAIFYPVNLCDLRLSNCIFGATCSGTGGAHAVYNGSNIAVVTLWNCIAYGFKSGSDDDFSAYNNNVGGSVTCYNCLAYGNRRGFHNGSTGTFIAINCISCNNDDDFSDNGIGVTADYCASDDGDGTHAVDWTAEATDWDNVFTDHANGDFSLKNFTGTGKIIGVGTDNPGSGLYSDDVRGLTRTSTWDIGAFEYAESEISGSTCWGHSTGVTERNTRTFTGNWTGTGSISGASDAEVIELNSGENMVSEKVNTGAITVQLLQNSYNPAGDNVTLQYRTAATSGDIDTADWVNYTTTFTSLGYVQIKVISTL